MELNQAQCRVLGINAGFMIFIIIIMGMRMWARLVITKAIGLDDIMMAFGTLMTIALSITVMISVVRGIGKARVDIPAESWEPMLLQAFWDAAGIIVIITDICLWICPIPMIWNLQLPKRQKWAVSAVFALGIISVVAGCVRFYYVRQLANEPELYQQLAYSLVWYALELYVAIFCGCSSALKVFFKRYFPALLGSSSPRTGYSLDSCGNAGTKTRTSHPLTDLSDRLPGNHTVISSGWRGRRVTTKTKHVSTNDSEEAIMSSEEGIQKQTEIQVRQEVARVSTT
ncbi:integral membrane protein [Colletotrichum asianum]